MAFLIVSFDKVLKLFKLIFQRYITKFEYFLPGRGGMQFKCHF